MLNVQVIGWYVHMIILRCIKEYSDHSAHHSIIKACVADQCLIPLRRPLVKLQYISEQTAPLPTVASKFGTLLIYLYSVGAVWNWKKPPLLLLIWLRTHQIQQRTYFASGERAHLIRMAMALAFLPLTHYVFLAGAAAIHFVQRDFWKFPQVRENASLT